jgi:hypothetical protein
MLSVLSIILLIVAIILSVLLLITLLVPGDFKKTQTFISIGIAILFFFGSAVCHFLTM